MKLSTYSAITRIEIANSTAYRAVMLLSLITGPIFIITQYFIWSAVFSQTETVGGYAFEGIFVYYLLAVLLMYILYSNPEERISNRVRDGEMHSTLLRPISLMGEQFSILLGHRFIAIIIEVLPVTALAALVFGTAFLIPKGSIVLILCGLAIAIVIEFLIRYLVGLVAFWTKTIHGLRMMLWPMRVLLTGLLIPLDLAPVWAQKILFFLPWQHVVYAPISYYLDSYSLAGVTNPLVSLAYGVFWAAFLFVLAHNIQKRGYKKYEGVGQ